MRSDGAGGFHEVTEELADLRSTAGDVHDLGTMFHDPCADLAGGFLVHHLGPRRSGIDVAMGARLVALPADIDLERLERTPDQRDAPGLKCFLK